MNEVTRESFVRKEFRLEWRIAEGLRAVYANHLLVSHQDGQFVLNFAEAVPPPMHGDVDVSKTPDSVISEVFLRIAVPTNRVPGMIRALQSNYDNYVKENELGIFDPPGEQDV